MTYKDRIKRFANKVRYENISSLSPLGLKLYSVCIRPFWSKQRRLFFEGSSHLPAGQMFAAERRAIYETIVERQPKQCIEIGTCLGGGSTFFMALAFEKVGSGRVVSTEAYSPYYRTAVERYRKHIPGLARRITFINTDSTEPIVEYIRDGIGSFFLDGAEDAAESEGQYRFFLPYCRSGDIFMAHDWCSEKMRLVRPLVEADPRWKKLVSLEPPQSVGFVVYMRG